jgi:hypothetical protein
MHYREIIKVHHDLNFPTADALQWYIGLYLGLPRVFMSIVRRKMVQSPAVESVLVPLHTVCDPITGRPIHISITDRYFFVGTNQEIGSEEDLGIQSHIKTIMLLRDDASKLSKITPSAIRTVIREHLQKRKVTIQPDLTVCITAGTFRDWYGIVEGTSEDRENTQVRFTSDDYNYVTDMPTVLCKAAT